MCKRHPYAPAAHLASEGAYEGQTVSLDLRKREWGVPHETSHGWKFHWWALWLIWPLIELTKWATPLVLIASATVTASLGEFGAQCVAITLIVAGVALLRRN